MAVRLVMLGSTHVLWWETGASHENAGLCAGAVREPAGEDSPGLLQVRLAVTAVNAGRAFSFLCVIFIALFDFNWLASAPMKQLSPSKSACVCEKQREKRWG